MADGVTDDWVMVVPGYDDYNACLNIKCNKCMLAYVVAQVAVSSA